MTHSGGKPHTNVGDEGQRFEVTFDDGNGNRKVLGWAETTNGVADFMHAIELHPTWHSPQWRDRQTGETSPAPPEAARVSDVYLTSTLQEISRAKALDSQMVSTAFLRMLLAEILQRRAADQTPARPGTSPTLIAYEAAMQAAGVPREPLAVYASNSWLRIGLARTYKTVIVPTAATDGQLSIDDANVLDALVAAFNVMLELSQAKERT